MEKAANEIESSLLEAAEMGEATLQQNRERPGSPTLDELPGTHVQEGHAQEVLPLDQVVPHQEVFKVSIVVSP